MPGEASEVLIDLFGAAPQRDDLIVSGGRRVSSTQIVDQALAIAAAFNARGVGHGDLVAFQMPTGIDAIALYRACWRVGAVAVPVHPRAGAAQIADLIDQSHPSLLVSHAGSALADEPGALDIADLSGGEAPEVDGRDSDDALVMFTSGATGRPKGAVHTHASLVVKTRQIAEVHGLTSHDCVLMPAPLAHVSGLLHGVLVPAALGAKAVLMERWNPTVALQSIEREQVTWMVGPPTFFIDLMDDPAFDPERVASLRLISCGGAGVTPAFAQRAGQELGAVVKRTYGSTEAPSITTSRFDDPAEQMIHTDGRAFGDTRIRVDDHGELWVSGPEICRGYLDPTDTVRAFEGGWFRTGDLGVIDDGWLTITGRLGDQIIRGGENISAIDIENHLEAHPAVSAAAVLGEPHDRLGERVAAFVVADEAFDLDACRQWFKSRGTTSFACPERLEHVSEMPVLASGKIDRAALARWLTISGDELG
ncbi:MAG: cyclohexanecarboxylate-CoA ligase [Acidimicrobiaceae bacterium]|nr:cyclohexanecarboxylate-CoA ligase [Acidimicrobiaceae bacterium]MYG56615.1 cyclohexanecarboxylate-CoA ligase [Acidimicrobiaceae bacterium]MYJ99161.1 cyclohexanecarboxylate-CoA ligase [Acidimicrobiaceae bacterium]